jgi:integrase
MRNLKLEPKKIEGRTSPWRIYLPPYLSSTGKPQQLFYKTRDEAKTAANALKIRSDNFGKSLGQLSSARIAEAAQVFSELDEHFPNVALIEVYRVFAEHYREKNASVSFDQAFTEYLALPKKRDHRYVVALKRTREKFSYLGKKRICDVKPKEIAVGLEGLPPSSRNAQMRHLNALFNFARDRRHWLNHNPIGHLDFAELDKREPEIFEPEAVQRLLDTALAEDLTLLPWLVFGLFCGIRPDGELSKLDWSDIHLGDRQIVIRPEVSKTRRRRFPDLSENAIVWIRAYIARGGSTKGKVMPLKRVTLSNRKLRLLRKAGGLRWIHQGARHSFCSYWLAKHHDVNKLVLLSGHDDPDTMWQHYHRGTTEAQAERFWGIVPRADAVPANVVGFKQA